MAEIIFFYKGFKNPERLLCWVQLPRVDFNAEDVTYEFTSPISLSANEVTCCFINSDKYLSKASEPNYQMHIIAFRGTPLSLDFFSAQ